MKNGPHACSLRIAALGGFAPQTLFILGRPGDEKGRPIMRSPERGRQWAASYTDARLLAHAAYCMYEGLA